MNKRFFTLMAAVMLAGAPLCNEAFAASNPVVVSAFADNVVLANGVKFVMKVNSGYLKTKTVKNTATNTTYAVLEKDDATIEEATVLEVVNFQKTVLGATFSISVDGNIYACVANGTAIAENTAKGEIKTIFQVTSSANADGNYTLKALAAKVHDGTATIAAGKFLTRSLDYADENLNEFNANATTFSFEAENLEGDVFKGVTPFTYEPSTLGLTGTDKVTILVKGKADDIKSLTKASTDLTKIKKALEKLNVVYVQDELWGLNTKAIGEGYKVALISGADFSKEKDAALFNNAGFTNILEADQLNNEQSIQLTIAPTVGKQTSAVYVKAVKTSASDTKAYVTTVNKSASQFKTLINPTLGDNTYFAATEFLKAGAASVYNVYFTSGEQSIENDDQHEYHKYLTVAPDAAASAYELQAAAKADANLNSPLAQWIVTNFDGRYTLTLKSREGAQTLSLKLSATDKAGEYLINSDAGTIKNIKETDKEGNTINKLKGMKIRLIPATTTKTDGYLALTKDEMKAGIRLSFTGKDKKIGAPVYYLAKGTNKLVPSLKDKNVVLDVEKADDVYSTLDYAYIDAKGKTAIKASGDTLVVPNYKLSLPIYDATTQTSTTNTVKGIFDLDNTATTSSRYFFKKAMNGEYVMSLLSSTPSVSDAQAANSLAMSISNGSFGAATYLNAPQDENFAYVTVGVKDLTDYTTLEAVSRHATLENSLGAVTFRENKNGILEGIMGAEPMTFWLDTADSEKTTPSFYISKGIATSDAETKAYDGGVRNFLYMPADSAVLFNEETAQATVNEKYILEGTNDYTTPNFKAIFRPANLIAEDTLATVVEGKEVKVVGDAIKAFQFGICAVDDSKKEFLVYSKKSLEALYNLNGKLGFTSDWNEALTFTLGEGDATANEAIAAENVAVIAGEGVVTVKGAAGKQVVVSNILGQVIANKVATSDEETIAVAAGVAVVVVDGEATKVVVK